MRALLNAPARDIDCSSSIFGSDIDCAEIAKLPYVFFKPPKRRRGKADHHLMRAGAGATRTSDEDLMFIGAMQCVFSRPWPVDHPVCVSQCRDDASLAAYHRPSQPRLRRSGLGLRSASTADPLRRHPWLRRPLEVWRRHGVGGDALRLRASRSALSCSHFCRIAQTRLIE
jgi:hypothetical protein